MTEHTHKSRHTFLIYPLLVAAIVLAYEPMRHNDFISYDDPDYVTRNPHITGGLTAESVIWAFTKPHYHMYHPLTSLSHMLDCELFGLDPFWHHAASLFFHMLNALLLFWVLKRMTGAVWASAFVAAIFALHPLQVDSVAWVAERKSVLSGSFWILTMITYVFYSERPGPGRYLLVVVGYVLALLSKPVVISLPFALLLLDYWPLRRIRTKSAENKQSEKPRYRRFSAKRLIVEKVPLLILSAALCVITIFALHGSGAVMPLETIPIRYRIANAFIAYLKYIQNFIWPSKLAVLYPHPADRILMIEAATCALVLISILGLCIYLGNRKRYLPVGWLWFIGTLVPVIGIVQAGAQAMADRYMYVPIIGLLIIIAWGAGEASAKMPYRTILLALSAAVVLSAAVICTRRQVAYWRDNLTLFGHTLKVTQNNAIIHNSYGCALCDAGQADAALTEFQKALEIIPTFSKARYNLGKLLFSEGKLDQAVACFQGLLKIHGDSAEPYYYLGLIHNKKRQPDQAAECFSQALRGDPNYIEAHSQLGGVYLAANQIERAIEHFNDVVRLDAGRTDAYASLGMAYMKKGRLDLAVSNWSRAVELNPSSAPVLNNLAWVLAANRDTTVRNPAKAVQFALRACELTDYKDPAVLDTLAVAYAADDRFEHAAQTATKAIRLAESAGQKELADEIRRRLRLYQANTPYYDQ